MNTYIDDYIYDFSTTHFDDAACCHPAAFIAGELYVAYMRGELAGFVEKYCTAYGDGVLSVTNDYCDVFIDCRMGLVTDWLDFFEHEAVLSPLVAAALSCMA